jgi:hypothetical protein
MDPEDKIFLNEEADPSSCNLTPKEAFLFSRIDQPITIKHLVQISGMQKDEALEIIQKLLDSQLIKSGEPDVSIPSREPGVVIEEESTGGFQEFADDSSQEPSESATRQNGSYTYDDIFSDTSDTGLTGTPDIDYGEPVPEDGQVAEQKSSVGDTQPVGPEDSGVSTDEKGPESKDQTESTQDQQVQFYKRPSTGEKYQHETGYKFKLGMKAKRSGDLLGAERFIGAAVALNPKISHYWWHLAMVQKDMNKLEDAESSCLAALEVDEKNRDYLKTLIEIQNLMGKTEDAAATAKRLRSVELGDLERMKDLQTSASSWIHRIKSSLSDKFKK